MSAALPMLSVDDAATRITVIIPTYERPHFLRDALRSVLAQSRPVHEVLVIDDCSSAANWRQVQREAVASSRVKVHRLDTHRGAAAARNRGLDLATGDYVLFLDDDDLLEPRMCERSAALLDADAALDAMVCRRELVCIPGGEVTFRVGPPRRRALEQRPFAAILRRSLAINSCLIRRAAIGALRFPEDLTRGEEQYLWLALATQGRRFALRPEPDAVVRRHARNMTRSRLGELRASRHLYEKLLADQLPSHRDDFVLIYLKLSYCEWASGNADWKRHFAMACRHPIALLREIAGYATRALPDPVGFVRHYFLA